MGTEDNDLLRQELEAMRNERAIHQRQSEQMLFQMNTMMELLKARDEENAVLRDSVRDMSSSRHSSTTATAPTIPYTEIAKQIPQFGGNGKESIDVETWVTRVEDLKEMYELSDETIRVLATNKLIDTARQWYDSEEDNIKKSWSSLKEEIIEMFSTYEDIGSIMDKIRSRKWRRGERFEDYYHEKLLMTRKAKLTETEAVSHMIRGIENFSIRTQMITAQHSDLKTFFKSMKLIATEISTSYKRSDEPRSTPKCDNCKKEGHTREKCRFLKNKTEDKSGSTSRKPVCFKCNREGHISRFCTFKTENNTSDNIVVGSVNTINQFKPNKYYKFIRITGDLVDLKALVDTGCKTSLIKKSNLDRLKLKSSDKCNVLVGLNQIKVLCDSVLDFEAKIDNHIYNIHAIAVPDESIEVDIILGQSFLNTVNMTATPNEIKFDQIVNESGDAPDISFLMNIDVEESEKELNIHPDISNYHKIQIRNLIENCTNEMENPEGKSPVKLKIELKSENPVKNSPRRLAQFEKEKVTAILEDWLQKRIIRPSVSEYSSPIVLTKKKNGEYRLCVDYRSLNAITVRDQYPLPHIDDLISELSEAKYFTVLDLKNGFFHINVDENSIKFTSFVVPQGQFEFLKMPFGLSNSPSVFQRYVNTIFQDLIKKRMVQIYMDDILIGSKTIEEHVNVLSIVCEKIREYGIKLRLDKCHFAKEQIEYLGYRISYNTIKPGLMKTKAVRDFPTPTTRRQLRGFLGLTGYFRKFVKGYSIIAKPLTDLLRKEVPFKIGPEEIKAINILKNELTSEPTLKIYDPTRETQLHTDASSRGYAAVLLQKGDDDKYHPVSYFSTKTTESEAKMHSFELETKAVVLALDRFRIYLLGRPFTLITDCQALKQTLGKKEINSKICRWSLMMQDFEFKTEHRSGDKMTHVDSLSRQFSYGISVNDAGDDLYDLGISQEEDPEIMKLKRSLSKNEDRFPDYIVANGKVMRKLNDKLLYVVPRKLRRELVEKIHSDISHLGIDKTLLELRRNYYFKNMRKYVIKRLKNCLKCIEFNYRNRVNEGYLHPIDKGERPWHTIHIDHLGPLEKTKKGNRFIFEIIDGFSKFVIFKSTKTTNTEEALKHLRELFELFGSPARIISDRGSAFTSAAFVEFCDELNIKLVHIAVQTPRANGQIERYNKVIMPALLKESTDPTRWDEAIGKIQVSINRTIQRSTGRSPSDVLLGYKISYGSDPIEETLESESKEFEFCEQRIEARKEASRNIKKTQEDSKERYDQRSSKPTEFHENQQVAIKGTGLTDPNTCPKMQKKYVGPYIIKKKLENDRYVVTDVPGQQRTQKPYESVLPPERMKPWPDKFSTSDESEESSDDNIPLSELRTKSMEPLDRQERPNCKRKSPVRDDATGIRTSCRERHPKRDDDFIY